MGKRIAKICNKICTETETSFEVEEAGVKEKFVCTLAEGSNGARRLKLHGFVQTVRDSVASMKSNTREERVKEMRAVEASINTGIVRERKNSTGEVKGKVGIIDLVAKALKSVEGSTIGEKIMVLECMARMDEKLAFYLVPAIDAIRVERDAARAKDKK